MPRKSARLRIQEIKQPSTAETPVYAGMLIIQTLIEGLCYSFSLFSLCHFVSLLKYKLAVMSFFILQCSGERRQAAGQQNRAERGHPPAHSNPGRVPQQGCPFHCRVCAPASI